MPALDRLLDAMTRLGAEEVILESGRPPCLQGASGPRPLNGNELSARQIVGLLAEVAPPGFQEQVKARPNLSFRYSPTTNGARPVVVDLARVEGALKANVRWAPAQTNGHPAALTNGNGHGPKGSQPELDLPPDTATTTATESQPAAAIDRLFDILVTEGGSDLHLSVSCPPKMRLHGEIVTIPDWPVFTEESLKELLYEIAPEKNIKEFEETADTDFAYPFRDICRMRCNLYRDRFGIGGVFRQIPNEILGWEELGLPRKVLDLCFLSKGLVVVTGPTGSGKSTTLAALIDYINQKRTDHIITIEDPIEFVHPNKNCLVHQREVGVHTQSFKRALRAALREDPDIVLVGEMRDLETVAIAIETAETGHLVFGTLHTNTAASTVDRIIDQFPGDRQGQIRTMLSESLKGIIAQTLCKKKGGGRMAAYEILLGIPAVSNLIREGKTFQIPSIMQTGRQHGLITMNQSLIDLVKKKVVEPAEAYLKSVDQMDMLTQFKKHDIPFDPEKMGS